MSPRTSNAVTTFITHLRLLDIDRLEDWPGVTEDLFTPKHVREKQKQRIRCVEWALYRLFELWNSKEAKDKLQPFFPPYESLRSLNLRAALFRCLNELKKDGTLGKEIVVRKSMFDECRGDRFDELLASFSTVVLQKVRRTQPISRTSIAGRLTTVPKIPRKDEGSLLPLAIAHQGALRALLRRKELLRERYAKLQTLLEAKEHELLNRVDELARADQVSALEAISDRTVQVNRRHFDNWQGDTRWVNTIVEAEVQDVRDPLLDTPFSTVWKHAESNTMGDVGTNAEEGLMQNLNRRVFVQQERLSYWQKIQQGLIDSRPKSPTKISGKTTPYRHKTSQSPLKFSYQEQYAANADSVDLPISPEMKMHHRKLLEYSHQKTKLVKSPRKLGLGLPANAWDGSRATECSNRSQEERVPWFSELESTPTPTPAPTTLMTSLERDTKAEVRAATSPNASTVQRNEDMEGYLGDTSSPTSASALRPLHYEKGELPARGVYDDEAVRPIQVLPISANENQYQHGSRKDCHQVLTPHSESATSADARLVTQEGVLAQKIITSALDAEPSLVKRKTSLMERTRQSMAFSELESLLPDPLVEPIPPLPEALKHSHVDECVGLNRSSSLLERTRRSMSVLPAAFPSKGSHPSIHKRRQSKQYPSNQFTTPKKQLEDLEEMTPPDALFSPEADYASVFKSRPKIATSPDLSPTLAGRMQLDGE
ncbi:MAG: hypothetical protein Q9186_001434 [Xanthomendoza sp. 1 TL-2023]